VPILLCFSLLKLLLPFAAAQRRRIRQGGRAFQPAPSASAIR